MSRSTSNRIALAIQTLFLSTVISMVSIQSIAKVHAAELERLTYDVPGGSLEDALYAFAKQSGVTISFKSDLVKGKTAQAYKGTATKNEVLNSLLKGTGLEPEIKDGAVVIKQGPGSSASHADTLPEVKVTDKKVDDSGIHSYHATTAQSATKTETSLNKTPQSVSVVGADQIRDQGAQALAEALRSVAGLDAGQRGRRGFDDLSVRGFVQSSYLLRDGMRVDNDLWVQNEVFGLERIEVSKGPGSVLYGQIPAGGVVNLITKRPTSKPLAEVGVGYGNYAQKRLTADFSDSLNEAGTVKYRVTAISSASDDQVDFVDRQRFYIAPTLSWDITDNTSITFLANYQKDDYIRVFGLPALGTVLPNANGKLSYSTFTGVPGFDNISRKSSQVGYFFEHKFNDHVTFKQNLRYIHYTLDGAFTSVTALAANQRNLSRSGSLQDIDGKILTIDNQLGFKFDTGEVSHHALVGVDRFKFDSHRYLSSRTMTPNFINIYNPNYAMPTLGPEVTNNLSSNDELVQTGFYVQDQLAYGNWNLIAGLRYDKSNLDENRVTGVRTITDTHATTGRLGLLYAFESGFSPFISYSESFLPVTGTTQSGGSLDPETGEQREIGLKYESPDQRYGATLAVFDIQRQNVTTTVTDASGTYNVQVGEQRHKGFEFESAGQVTDRLKTIITYTYIDAEVTKSTQGNAGLRPIQVPKNMANVWLTYDFNTWISGLSVGAGARYIGEQAGNNLNTFNVPHYTVYDAAIYYTTGPWRFALNGRNLQNKNYIASCFPTNFTAAVNNATCGAGDPKMLFLTANYSFK